MRAKPDINNAIVLREAGFTIAVITARTGLSASTLFRAFAKLDITRGSITKDTLESAKQQLLEQSGLVGDLKNLISSQISCDLSLSAQLKTGVAMALEELLNDTTVPASLKARSYASLATTLKVISDIQRRCLRIQDETLTVSEVPILTIVKMSPADIAAVQSKLNSDDFEDDDLIFNDVVSTAE